jgi:hypothetical protein
VIGLRLVLSVAAAAAAINNRGKIAGFYTDATGGIHGFMDNHGVFTTVDAPGATTTELFGLNDHGIAVGEDIVGGVTHGIIYNNRTGKFTTLDDPNAVGSTVFNGINNKGDIVGFYSDAAGNTHGLLAVPADDAVAKLGQHMASAFMTTSDGHGGTLVTDPSLTSNQSTFLTPTSPRVSAPVSKLREYAAARSILVRHRPWGRPAGDETGSGA